MPNRTLLPEGRFEVECMDMTWNSFPVCMKQTGPQGNQTITLIPLIVCSNQLSPRDKTITRTLIDASMA